MSKGKSASRRGERAQAFQVLYGLSFADATSLEDVRRAFLQSPDHQETEEGELPSGFAWDLVQGVWSRRDELDKTISRFSRNWRVDRMGRVELTLLRLAMYELLYRQDVPAKPASSAKTTPPVLSTVFWTPPPRLWKRVPSPPERIPPTKSRQVS